MRQFLLWAVVAALVLDTALIWAYYTVKDQSQFYLIGKPFPDLVGVDLNGEIYRPAGAGCYVIRITAESCQYCALDHPAYSKLVEAAGSAACEVIELSPVAGDLAALPRASVRQLKYVDMQLGEAILPWLTPQTIILDSERRVLWKRAGVFSSTSLREGIAVVDGTLDR